MSDTSKFTFRLFVAGDAGNSAQAIANLSALCRTHLPQCHSIDIVDVFLHAEVALAEGVFMTPTLVRLDPGRPCRIVGTLSESAVVLQALGVVSIPA